MAQRFLRVVVVAVLAAACKKDPPPPTPQQEAEGYYLKATNEYLQANYDGALAAYAEVRKLTPDDPRLPAAIGEVYILQGKWDEARLQFQEATQRDPKRATNWSRLAYIQAFKGDKASAVESLKKALELNPKDFTALEQQAELAQLGVGQHGEFDGGVDDTRVAEAANLWARAAALAPDYRQGDLYLRGFRLLLSAGKPDEARKLLDDAAASGTKAPEVHATLGELHVRANDFESAAKAYERAAQNSPVTKLADGGVTGDSTYWEILGRLYTRKDDLEKAQAAYQQAMKLDDRAVIHVALARLAFLRGDERGASEELNLALSTARGEEVRETLEVSDLLAEVGRKQDALMLLESHASAEDGVGDVELQLQTARLAKELKQFPIVQAACARALRLDAGVAGCP